jgi:nucleotide-binding universal stress UspA family protein
MGIYRQVIVGSDGSVTAERAVRRAATIAHGLDSPLLVATAYRRARPEDLGPRSQRSGQVDVEGSFGFGYMAAQETAQDGAGIANRAAQGIRVDTATPQGDPADALLELAEASPPSMLVVGGQGLSASGLFLLGNVPHKVLHHAVGDTLVVRTAVDRAEGAPDRVLVGTDGSATATRALERGAEVAKALGAAVTVLAVGRADWAADVLAEAAARIGAHDVPVATEHHDGDPAAVLVERSADHGLLVLGNRGMTGIRRFVLGSVPNKVSHHVPADLLIVKTT